MSVRLVAVALFAHPEDLMVVEEQISLAGRPVQIIQQRGGGRPTSESAEPLLPIESLLLVVVVVAAGPEQLGRLGEA
jgi:hypothetical protein